MQISFINNRQTTEAILITALIITIAIIATITTTEKRTVKIMREHAVENNAAHWIIKPNKISGETTKIFKWGPAPNEVNEPNEQPKQ